MMMSSQTPQLTCLTCQVIFATGELQRNHYRCDWHRYNLKRKVANLFPISAEEFAKRVLAQKVLDALNDEQSRTHCKSCKKSFASRQAFENHLQSKRHFEQMKKVTPGETQKRKGPPRIRPTVTERLEIKTPNNDGSEESEEWEDLDEDDMEGDFEEISEKQEDTHMETNTPLPMEPKLEDCIPPHVCLFCNKKSASLELNLEHMAGHHTFFVPDPEYVEDLEGLIKYLGYKVGALKVCLLCDNDQKTPFRTIHAVQQHMLDLGHTSMYFENALEYGEFYDYSSTHPEGTDPDEEFDPELIQMNPDWSIQLPSGIFVGHRSLARYYRQHLGPKRPAKTHSRGVLLFQNYKALGWTGATTKEEALSKARDQKFAQKIIQKSQMKLGVRANKLQHHFRDRNMF